jgi:methionine-rich copper-binding protein CopC
MAMIRNGDIPDYFRAASRAVWRKLGMSPFLYVLAIAGDASAHAFLERAEPAVGSTAKTAPAAVVLHFTQAIEPAFASVTVDGPDGKPIPAEAPVHPADDALSLRLPALGPGAYVVHWKVMSIDTHATEGSFRFTVAPP